MKSSRRNWWTIKVFKIYSPNRYRFKIAVWILALVKLIVKNLTNASDNHESKSITKNVTPSKLQELNKKNVSINLSGKEIGDPEKYSLNKAM